MNRNFPPIIALYFLSASLAFAEDTTRTRTSPNGSQILEWSDHDAGETFGQIRKIVFRNTARPFPLLTILSVPRRTDAQWNSTSTKLILVDAPDSEEPRIWLIHTNNEDRWVKERIDLLAGLRTEFEEQGQASAFDPLILEISWGSDTSVSFHTICKRGTFLITVNTSDLTVAPVTKQISEHIMEPKNQIREANKKSEQATPMKLSD